MCITLEPATLASTILVAHEVEHDGRSVNVVGYQNKASSAGAGPNAMILPIPSAAPMGPANCIDMTGAEQLFGRYEDLVRPVSRSRGLEDVAVAAGPDLRVFDSGSYTVVLTRRFDLERLQDVLAALPADKRLELGAAQMRVFDAFRELYPGWHLAICIWSGTVAAEPILWWYEPLPAYVDKHFLPGLDAHDGNPPDPSLRSVPIDHTLIVGTDAKAGPPNAAGLVDDVPKPLRKWLPRNVFGALLHNTTARNGDWVFDKSIDRDSRLTHRRIRVPPPGHAAA